jgi:hypothetical protein
MNGGTESQSTRGRVSSEDKSSASDAVEDDQEDVAIDLVLHPNDDRDDESSSSEDDSPMLKTRLQKRPDQKWIWDVW